FLIGQAAADEVMAGTRNKVQLTVWRRFIDEPPGQWINALIRQPLRVKLNLPARSRETAVYEGYGLVQSQRHRRAFFQEIEADSAKRRISHSRGGNNLGDDIVRILAQPLVFES